MITFGILRVITAIIQFNVFPNGPFHFVMTKSGLHIHHMVPGMLLALGSGYLGLVLTSQRPARLLAVLFGIGTALVLLLLPLVLVFVQSFNDVPQADISNLLRAL